MSDLRRRVEELEAQLAQQQKLMAIGSLAGGVAHDFNNLLTAILGYASLLKEDPSSPPHVVEAVEVIEKAAERASQLTGQLLGFARKGDPKRIRVDLHQILSEVVDLLRHTIDKNIRIETVFDAPDPYVMGDPSQLFQVFLNLALNARDAMPEGGSLTLRTSAPQGQMQASVIDTGMGIPGAIRERIFDPFFTTKGPNKGTGMGLTVVQRIVKSHGGALDLDCEHPPGTRFHILLPLANNSGPLPPVDSVRPPSRGKGAVLLVDDEEFVRQVAARMLKGLGYHPICLESATEAIEYFRRRNRDIDAVIVDLVMPDLGGKACYEALREIDQQVRVVLTSGYSHDSNVDEMINMGVKAFLQKPYRVNQLSEVLAKVIPS